MGKTDDRSYTLITGGSAGIGFELAKCFAKDGNNLIIVGRDRDKLDKAKEDLKIYNVKIEVLEIDLSVEKACEKVFDFVDKKNLSVDCLVNNAGVGSFGYFHEIGMTKELDLIQVNIKVVTELTKWFLRRMIESEHGAIINIASTAAFTSGPKMGVYYASKAYVVNFTEALYEEYKDKGIKISCICPGPVSTDFQNKAGIKKSEKTKGYMMSSKKVAELGYRDFKKGKLIIIPGIKNKVLVFLNNLLPRWTTRKIILRMNKG